MVKGSAMRMLIVISVAMACCSSAFAQKASTDAEIKTDRKGAERIVTTDTTPTLRPKKPRVAYGGFLAETSKAPNKRESLSLRKRVQMEGEPDNVFRDAVTGRPRGFVLFAIRF
jgi:hypothetical protein